MSETFGKIGTLAKYSHVESRLVARGGSSDGVRLTIAIPTYKRPALLSETLQSVSEQTAEPALFDIIVIDNDPEGDDETAAKLISSFGFQNFAYYRNAENIGLFGNWNRCIELSESERLTILHDDDLIGPNYVRNMLDLFCLDPRAMLSCGFVMRVESRHTADRQDNLFEKAAKGLMTRIRGRKLRKRTVQDYFFRNPNVGSLGIILNKRCATEMGGFDENEFPSSDYFFFFEYMRRYNSFHLHERLAVYRIGYNESLKNETSVGFVYKNFGFRTYVARLCRSSLLAALVAPLTVTELKVIKSFWGNTLDEGAILRDLKIAPAFNRNYVATLTRIGVALRDMWADMAARRYPRISDGSRPQ